MLLIISKQTREKKQTGKAKDTPEKTNKQRKKKHKKKHTQKNKLCTYQMEPTFGDRKQFQTQNMVDIYIYIYIFFF